MKYLIDTCVISEFLKKNPDERLMTWLTGVEESALYVSVLTFGEIQKGISKLHDSKKKRVLSRWLGELERRFDERIVPVDLDIFLTWGRIQGELETAGKSMPSIDGLIASTGLAKNMTVVSRNDKDMKRSGVQIVNPWEAA